MTDNCTSYVNAGAGFCSLKRGLKQVSLYCQDVNKQDPNCQIRLKKEMDKMMACNPCHRTSPECDLCNRGEP
jgi:hypothetical protein